jgi:hypothetical protein
MPARSAAILAFLSLLVGACGGSSNPSGLHGTDRASEAGVARITRSWSSPVGDINLDGKPDFILVTHFTAPDSIFVNTGGRFVELAPKTLFARDRHSCAIGDVNRDGLPDIFCAIGGHRGTAKRSNELWLQQKDHTFVDKAKAYGVTDELGRGRSPALVDVNKDGYVDLFVANQTPRADRSSVPNRLYINERGLRFRSEPNAGLDVAIGSVCLKVVDWDSDGDPDFLNCGNTAVQLFRNEGGRFTEIAKQLRLLPVPPGTDQRPRNTTDYRPHWKDAALSDLNGDGYLDAIGIAWDGLVIQRGSASGFAPPRRIKELYGGWALAIGDINKDSRLDVYALQTCLNGKNEKPDFMFINNGSLKFSEVPMDESTRGCGESVTTIDYNADGRSDFIVLNGYGAVKGPVQLIDFAPEPNPPR